MYAAAPGECKISGTSFSKLEYVHTGVWECEPGGFEVRDRDNTESVYIISGKVTPTWGCSRSAHAPHARAKQVRITDLNDGHGVELSAGDALVLPKGCSVRWDVLETVRKFFVLST
jgi:uncharacterized cupin superfamily protein